MTRWHYRRVPFKYQLSDWTILSISLPLQCTSIDLLAESTPQPLAPPHEELIRGSQGFMIRALPLLEERPALTQKDGYFWYVPLQYQHCYIDLTMSFDDYQGKFSSKTRSTINRKVKKYAEHCGGSIPWRTYQTAAEMREFFAHARVVSRMTYQERLLDAGIPGSEEFIIRAEALAATNSLRAYILFDGTKPVSYLYCPVNDGVLLYAYLGYDPDYMKLSVGTVLQWLALQQLFGEGRFRAFDFTDGQSDHKRLFSTHQRRCANVFFVKASLRNGLLVRSHLLVNRTSSWLGEKLDKLGVKSRVKRLLRFAA
jgi:Acetyltransferase (GNAT) domain